MVEALCREFERAVHEFIGDSEMDDEIKPKVQAHLQSMLCYEPYSPQTLSVTLAA